MGHRNDAPTVLTLDAGGTHLVFSALRGGAEVAPPAMLPARGDDLEGCLANIVRGLEGVRAAAGGAAEALACGFPGPANYPAGLVGPQKNLPCIREPLDLASLLRRHFGVPAFLFNDADLFVYGEALGGFLPWVNALLADSGSPRRYRSLFGITLGTGLGAGYSLDGAMVAGEHGGGPELWCLPSGPDPAQPAEEYASARAVRRSYATLGGIAPEEVPESRALFDIAEGRVPGNKEAAREAFRRLGEAAGQAAAQALSIVDCPLVVGGGLAGAESLIIPALVASMNSSLAMSEGRTASRMDGQAYDLRRPEGLESLLGERGESFSGRRFPVGVTRLGTSRAAALGAYAATLKALDGGPGL